MLGCCMVAGEEEYEYRVRACMLWCKRFVSDSYDSRYFRAEDTIKLVLQTGNNGNGFFAYGT